jgi:hypothetical protein
VNEETSARYTCTAVYSDGTSETVTPDWDEDSPYASISASGLLSAGDVTVDQSVTVTAVYNGESDSIEVGIAYVPPTVTGLAVTGPGSVGENSTEQYACTATYSDGTTAAVDPVWSTDSTSASISGSGLLSAGNVTADEQVTLYASYSGYSASLAVWITAVGDQVVFNLSGFEGKSVSAELWDDVQQTSIDLGEDYEPEQIVIENVNPEQWYWLGLREYDPNTGEWVLVHGRWIWM